MTVCVEVLQNGRLVRLSERTDCWCTFSCSICNQTATSSAISRAAIRKVMTEYTDDGKISSAERNCGRQPKLGARDRCILKRIVSKHHRTAAAKVTAELNIHHEDADSTKTVRRELHKSNIHDTVGTAKPLIIENNTRTRNRWCDNHKTRTSDDWQYVLWSDNRPSSCSQHQAERPTKPIILNAWFQL